MWNAGKIEEQVLDKCKVEDSKRGSYKGRGTPLATSKKQEILNWARIFSWFPRFHFAAHARYKGGLE